MAALLMWKLYREEKYAFHNYFQNFSFTFDGSHDTVTFQNNDHNYGLQLKSS